MEETETLVTTEVESNLMEEQHRPDSEPELTQPQNQELSNTDNGEINEETSLEKEEPSPDDDEGVPA